jgi:hypothetical protein
LRIVEVGERDRRFAVTDHDLVALRNLLQRAACILCVRKRAEEDTTSDAQSGDETTAGIHEQARRIRMTEPI